MYLVPPGATALFLLWLAYLAPPTSTRPETFPLPLKSETGGCLGLKPPLQWNPRVVTTTTTTVGRDLLRIAAAPHASPQSGRGPR